MDDKKPKLLAHVVIREEEFGAVAFDPQRGRMHKLNKMGLFIIQHCNGAMTVDEIVKGLIESTGTPKEVISKDVEEFLNDMYDRKLIEWK